MGNKRKDKQATVNLVDACRGLVKFIEEMQQKRRAWDYGDYFIVIMALKGMMDQLEGNAPTESEFNAFIGTVKKDIDWKD